MYISADYISDIVADCEQVLGIQHLNYKLVDTNTTRKEQIQCFV